MSAEPASGTASSSSATTARARRCCGWCSTAGPRWRSRRSRCSSPTSPTSSRPAGPATRPRPRRSCARSGSTRRSGSGSCPASRPRSRPGWRPRTPTGSSSRRRTRAYAAKHGKPRWADKTPHYVHHIDHLLRVWPGARFVVLVRDGRDVALSLRRHAVRPQQRLGGRAVVGARASAPARAGRARPPGRGADRPLRGHRAAAATTRSRGSARSSGSRYDPDMLALEHVDRRKIVPDQASWFPTIFDGINTRRGRALAARDEPPRPAHLRRARRRRAGAARLPGRSARTRSSPRPARRAGSTATTS